MVELLLETLNSLEYAPDDEPPGQKQKHQEVTNIVEWSSMFGCIFIAIVLCKKPSRIFDLFRYVPEPYHSGFHALPRRPLGQL